MLLVASETGHVYTFATPKLQPIITKDEGKNLIQACLNAPDDSAERPEAAESSKPKTAGGRKAAAKKETPAKEPKAKGGRKAAASASGAGVGPSADSQQTSVAPSPVLAGPGATSALGYQQASASPFAYASNYGLPQGATVLPYYVSNQNGQPQYLAYSYPGGGNAAQAAQQQVQLLMMNPDGTASYQTGGFNNAAQQLVLLQPQVDGGGAGGDGGAGEKRN